MNSSKLAVILQHRKVSYLEEQWPLFLNTNENKINVNLL